MHQRVANTLPGATSRTMPYPASLSAAARPSHCHAAAWRATLLLLVAGALAYSNSFSGDFVFDDVNEIANNPSLHRLWPPFDALLNRCGQLPSRPVPYFTFALNYAAHGAHVWGYHFVNLAIHLCSSLLLFGLLRRTLTSPQFPQYFRDASSSLAFSIALLWVLHPLHTQAVTYVYQRIESLMGFFLIATLYTFARAGTTTRSWPWLALSATACALGMATKEVMAVAPLLVLWYDRVYVAQSWPELARSRWAYYLGLGFTYAILAAVLLTQRGTWGDVELPVRSPLRYALLQSKVIVQYLRLSLWPVGQCLDHYPSIRGTWTTSAPYLVALTVLLAATIWAMLRRPEVAFMGAWFFLILAPTSSIMPTANLMCEYRMYLPLAAVMAVIVLVGFSVIRRCVLRSAACDPRHTFFMRALCTALVALVASAYLYCTYSQNCRFRSRVAIWINAVTTYPLNTRAWETLVLALRDRQEGHLAILLCAQALRDLPQEAEMHLNYGFVHFLLDNYSEAECSYRHALALDPHISEVHCYLADCLMKQQRPAEASVHYRSALRLVPREQAYCYKLGKALALSGELIEAEATLSRAVKMGRRFYFDATQNLTVVLCSLGRADDALELLRLSARPRKSQEQVMLASGYEEAGGALLASGSTLPAMNALMDSVELNPRRLESRVLLAKALAALGRHEQIPPLLEGAVELAPENTSVRLALANSLANVGELERAEALYHEVLRADRTNQEAMLNLEVVHQHLHGARLDAGR